MTKFHTHITSDVDVDKPDEKSIMTYVAQFVKAYPDPGSTVPVHVESGANKVRYPANRMVIPCDKMYVQLFVQFQCIGIYIFDGC